MDNPEDEEDETNTPSFRELLHQMITPGQARQIDRLLRELALHDENSYPYVNGLLTHVQLRTMAYMPQATAHAIQQTLGGFEAKVQTLFDKIQALSHQQHARLDREPLHTRDKTQRFIDWPLYQRYESRLATAAQTWLGRFEGLCAYRTRWLVLLCSVLIFGTCAAMHHHYNVQAAEWYQQERQTLEELKIQEARKTEAFCARATSDAQRWATQEVAARLEQLIPSSYRLAQQFERSGRAVMMPNNVKAWEVRIGPSVGYITSRDDFTNFLKGERELLLYFREDPSRLLLAKTSPATTPVPEANSKQKRP